MDKKTYLLNKYDSLEKCANINDLVDKLNTKYTITLSDICKLLSCTSNWVRQYITPKVPHIYVKSIILYLLHQEQKLLNNKMDQIYFHEDKLWEFISNNAIYTRQTIRIDLSQYILNTVSVDEFQKTFHHYKTLNTTIGEKQEAWKKVLNCLNDLGLHFFKDTTVKTRAQIPAIPVSDIKMEFKKIQTHNEINYETNFTTIKQMVSEGYKNNETCYNHFYKNGCIKAKFSGKSYFINPNKTIAECMITVPYFLYLEINK